MRSTSMVLTAAFLLFISAPAWSGDALVERVGRADLVVFGEVMNVIEGDGAGDNEDEPRPPIARVAVLEVLRGSTTRPALDVDLSRLTADDGPRIEPNQRGVWLLERAGEGAYAIRDGDQVVPADRLAEVRRAVTVVGDIAPDDGPAEDRAERVEELRAELEHERSGRRSLAAHKLGEMGAIEAVPDLIDMLDDSASSVRLAAHIALCKITGHKGALDFREAGRAVREPAIDAWRNWWADRERERAALRVFIEQLESDDAATRHAADLALGALTGHRVDVDFADAPEEARAAAVREWEKQLEEQPEGLRRSLLETAVMNQNRPQPEHKYAIGGLSQIAGPEALDTMRRAFRTGVDLRDSDLVIATADYFGRIRDRDVVPELMRLLDRTGRWEPSRPVRAALVAAVGRIAGRDFGTGEEAVERCVTWWQDHAEEFD